ncbi:ATP-dependent helicase [Paenibacillus aquistagni]|uniref:DNA 3'-5' helicase n=1 Tax=Paenibacillus aquistagni TaxID=1852522 RepID=A0A1X7LBK3_9BACL|nr:ATP-dependent helicase [Paenibacillus aquistagni]SMG50549.1 DNA helicase-2 / ATP-dependent DNA helicase PcrA [Paenibacillus aquistagni]
MKKSISSPAATSWTSRPQGTHAEYKQPLSTCISPDSLGTLSHDTTNDEDRWFFEALENLGLSLHHAQQEAVRHHEGPLLCLAGAGSGKTSVLTARAAYLMAVSSVPPESLWLVTFTNKAAAEIRDRLGRLPGITPSMARRVQARTFHSFALRLLQAYAPPFTLLAEERSRYGFMKRVLRELGLQEQFEAETALASLSALKSRAELPEDWQPKSPLERDLRRAMLRFEEQKQERNLKDFDDLLLDTIKLFEAKPELPVKLARRFQFVMVDEFQDSTPVQIALLEAIANAHRNLAVFGDDDQTIYTFNGANHRYITTFQERYPDAIRVTLDLNFRSTPAIVGLGNAIIKHNQDRLSKTMQAVKPAPASSAGTSQQPYYLRPNDAEEEAMLMIEKIQELKQQGHAYQDMAVLYRSQSVSRAMIEQLTMEGIPYEQLGREPLFYDHGLVKPVIDHLRLSLQPRDKEALGSAVACLYISREQGLRYIQQQEKERAKKYPLVHLASCQGIASFQQEAVKPRIRYIKKLASMKPALAVQDMRREFYDKFTQAASHADSSAYQDASAELLEELESSAKRFDTVEAFIKHIDELAARYDAQQATGSTNARGSRTEPYAPQQQARQETKAKSAPVDTPYHARDAEEADDKLTLMTIHRAKGLEFKTVFLLGITEELLPHRTSLRKKPPADKKAALTEDRSDRSAAMAVTDASRSQEEDVKLQLVEEERRLLYVGVTRAKNQLYISSPVVVHGDKQEISRFIKEAWQQ